MSRYIDADEFLKEYCEPYPHVFMAMSKAVADAPSIDIVRCKECDMSEVYQSDSNGVMARYCKAFTPTRMIADDDYCSYAERSEDE